MSRATQVSSVRASTRIIDLLEAVVTELRAVRTLLETQAEANTPAADASPIDALLGLRELSELLHLDERTVRRMRAGDELPKPTLGGRSPRWARSTVDAWLAKRGSS